MRLSAAEKQALITAVDQFAWHDEKVELRLYGSRVDDQLKGGDIDLLLVTQTEAMAIQFRKHKAELFARVFSLIDEQKIDLLIVDNASIAENPFAQAALEQSVLLHRWEKLS